MNPSMLRRHLLLPLAIIIITVAIIAVLHLEKAPLKKPPAEIKVQDVQVLVLEPQSYTVPIRSQGEITARTEVRLLPEVSGKIIEVSEHWINGGYFKKGEMMLRIEDHAYRNQVARTKANVAQAESNYIQEQGLAHVAEQEWKKRSRSKDQNPAAKALALRIPQLKSAKAQLEAAKAELKAAQLSLEKTAVVAPFDGILLKKAADIGQTISNGQVLGEFYAVDQAEVRVPLTESQQALIALPRLDEASRIPVSILFDADSEHRQRDALMVNTEGVLDEITKTLYARVVINDPYALQNSQLSPLRIGAFVEVEIQGRTLENVFVIPGELLRRGDTLWTINDNNQLTLQKIEYLKLREDNLVITSGLKNGDRLAVGSLIKPAEGKQINPVSLPESTSGE